MHALALNCMPGALWKTCPWRGFGSPWHEAQILAHALGLKTISGPAPALLTGAWKPNAVVFSQGVFLRRTCPSQHSESGRPDPAKPRSSLAPEPRRAPMPHVPAVAAPAGSGRLPVRAAPALLSPHLWGGCVFRPMA